MGLLKRFGQLGMLVSVAKLIQRQVATRRPASATADRSGGRSWQQAARRLRQR